MEKCVLFVTAFLFASAMGLSLPSNFRICPINYANRTQCLKIAVQEAFPLLKEGLPSLKFPKLEPLEIPGMTIGKGEGTVHVVQNFKNVKLYGISDIKINNISDTKTETGEVIVVDTFIKELRLDADYELDGKIVIVPVKGQGKCSIQLLNVTVLNTMHYNDQVKNGVRYRKVERFIADITPEKVKFRFDNLFGGDKALGDGVNNLLNEEWRAVFWDVKSGYEEALAQVFKNLANIIYTKVSFNDLFQP